MNYEEAIAYIHGKYHKGVKVGLENMKRLLTRLGNPQEGLRYIHVAGTNGKGSTCAMIESMLRHSGYKVGLYTSPFLMRYNERIRVDGQEIPDDAVARLTTRIRLEADQMEAAGEGYPTVFELGTALMFCWFCEQKVDYAVVEVGLGGRLDPTNVLTPCVSVITRIGLDHMKVLGDTIEKIAAEKGGIIKENAPVVLQAQDPCVHGVIAPICAQKGVSLLDCASVAPKNLRLFERGSAFSVEIPELGEMELHLPLCGAHQVDNAITALCAVSGLGLDKRAILEGMEQVEWPGRLEWFGNVLLDGAHNPQGAQTVRAYCESCLPGRTIRMITGVMADKDVHGVAAILCGIPAEIACVSPEHMARAEAAEELRAVYAALVDKPVTAYGDTAEALEEMRKKSSGNDVILICGSLYLVGEARKLLVE